MHQSRLPLGVIRIEGFTYSSQGSFVRASEVCAQSKLLERSIKFDVQIASIKWSSALAGHLPTGGLQNDPDHRRRARKTVAHVSQLRESTWKARKYHDGTQQILLLGSQGES